MRDAVEKQIQIPPARVAAHTAYDPPEAPPPVRIFAKEGGKQDRSSPSDVVRCAARRRLVALSRVARVRPLAIHLITDAHTVEQPEPRRTDHYGPSSSVVIARIVDDEWLDHLPILDGRARIGAQCFKDDVADVEADRFVEQELGNREGVARTVNATQVAEDLADEPSVRKVLTIFEEVLAQ